MPSKLKRAINAATTLEELRDAINAHIDVCGDDELPGDVDFTDLPLFGGEEPNDTGGIWSWNNTHVLIQGGGEPYFDSMHYGLVPRGSLSD